jgi:integrase
VCPKHLYKIRYKQGCSMKHVQYVRGRYVARITVPEELRAIIGKRELVENLGENKKASERSAHAALARFHAVIDNARATLAANRPTISSFAKAHYRSELNAHDREIAAGAHSGVELFRPHYAALLRLVAAGQIVGEEAGALIGYVDALAASGELPDLPRADLLRELATIQLEAMRVFEVREKGVVSDPLPTNPLLTSVEPPPASLAAPDRGSGFRLTDLLAAFHQERMAGGSTLAEKTLSEHRVAIRMLVEFLGGDIPAVSVTRRDLLQYKQALLRTPTNYAQRFPGLTLPQAIKKNADRAQPYPALNGKTINMKWLSALSSIFKWGMNNGYIENNPVQGVRVETGKREHQAPRRLPFTQQELHAMFSHPMFQDRSQYATLQWALLLALYTGARSAELAQIAVSDIFAEQGFPVIRIAGATKNNRSKRLIPVHTKLIDLGFLSYVEKLKQRGQSLLFADWKPEDKVNRWFLRTFRAEVGIDDSRKVFHSFRHTLKTALTHAGVTRDVSDKITGHADQSVASVYIHDSMVKAMSEGINKVTFEIF